MKTLDDLYKDLEKYENFDADPNNAEKFLDTVDAIVIRKDPSSIPVLFRYFDDETEYSWVLNSLKKAIEHYDIKDYVNGILKNLYLMLPNATEWAFEILITILNTPDCLTLFRSHMHLADREALLKLFDIMEKESPHHVELIQELRKELTH